MRILDCKERSYGQIAEGAPNIIDTSVPIEKHFEGVKQD